jgi:polyisoprenoid-binding protein YceI
MTDTRDRTEIPGYTAGTWTIDPIHSYVGFAITHLMVTTVRGQFETVTGEIVTDDNILDSTVAATIDAASFHTNNEERNAHVRSPDFLDTDSYPHITFASSGIRRDGDGYLIDGQLTIRGTTKTVTLTTAAPQFGPSPHGTIVAGFSASTEIRRSDFGVAFNMPIPGHGFMLGENVQVMLEIEAALNV